MPPVPDTPTEFFWSSTVNGTPFWVEFNQGSSWYNDPAATLRRVRCVR